ncbi:hypothetical protein LTS15_010273 [Exophiala xenobiotica]|nr:hypothetical protein LTS15_010273 [Exophiala xenobiotica]
MATTAREQIRSLRTPNVFGKHFVPFQRLDSLITASFVQEALRICGVKVYERDEVQEAIVNGGKRVFAILCLMEREKLIAQFSGNDNFLKGSLDSKLPLDEDALRRIIPDDYRVFYDMQFELSAPIFRPNLHHRSLHDNCILPFTKVEPKGGGAFGVVSKVTLTGSHQGILQDQTAEVVVARKELRTLGARPQEYENEQHILSLLRCLQHPNIIQFYTAYTLNHIPTLLFAPADYDLAEFFTKAPPQPQFESDHAVLQGLHGLSSAIAFLHNYFSEANNLRLIGCHYDIKPKNVLVTPGRFILADFGLSRLKSESDSSRSDFKGGISDYSGPECQDLLDDFQKHRIGRRSDIWSLGCILAEVVTYLALGSRGVTTFATERQITLQGFLTIRPFHAAKEPSKAVSEWLDALGYRPDSTEARRGLLDLIRHMLSFDPDNRPKSLTVAVRLFLLAQRARVASIMTDFELLYQRGEYGFKVELIRLRLWCKAFGIQAGTESDHVPSWFPVDNARFFETISNTLEEICQEVSTQGELVKLNSVEPLNHPTYYALRKQVGILWNALPMELVTRMTSSMETILLHECALDHIAPDSVTGSPDSSLRRAGLLLAMQQAMTSVNKHKEHGPQFLREKPVKIDGQISGKEIGTIETHQRGQQQVLIEMLEYEDKWVDRFDELVHRVDDLAALLNNPEIHTLFPTLRCVGFWHIVHRQAFGLLYELPMSSSAQDVALKPVTLVDLISRTQRRQKRPLLGELFAFAHKIASSIFEVHRAGWMHKGISAYNLLFFPEDSEPLAMAFNRPYLIGFNHSRESNKFVFTEGPPDSVEVRDYQHPDYRASGATIRFREDFDYYSVGIILLELGQWRPLRKMTREKSELSAKQIRDYLLEEEVPALGSYMGKAYQDAVESCLNGSISMAGVDDADSMRDAFQRKVVESLSSAVPFSDRRGESNQPGLKWGQSWKSKCQAVSKNATAQHSPRRT